MKKEMTREEIIKELLDMAIEGMDTSDFRELLKGDWKGYDNMTDAELVKEYWAILGECLSEEGESRPIIIPEVK
jgi:hypothetical protein